MLRGLQGDRTVLLCTHDLDEAQQLTSNVAVLDAGRLIAEGATNDVLGAEDLLALFRPNGGEAT
jgi:ABC-type multidrug transport system ATPase subunit